MTWVDFRGLHTVEEDEAAVLISLKSVLVLVRRGGKLTFDVAFVSHAAIPTPETMSWTMNDVWIRTPLREKDFVFDFGSNNGSWRFTMEQRYQPYESRLSFSPYIFGRVLNVISADDESLGQFQTLRGPLTNPEEEDIKKLSLLMSRFRRMFWREQPFASAPIRSSPRRTYDATRPLRDPEGAYVPTYLANMTFRDKRQWLSLKKRLESFGQESGLFDEIGVRRLGNTEGGPFQLQIRKFGTKSKGPKRNLIDVGYGVSQTLPVVAELFRSDSPSIFLFQQPEVHLHPSAQAALGSLFGKTAESGRQLIIETHSDYIYRSCSHGYP